MDDETRRSLERQLARLQRRFGVQLTRQQEDEEVARQVERAQRALDVDDTTSSGRKRTATEMQTEMLIRSARPQDFDDE